jgi:hypothetical protein
VKILYGKFCSNSSCPSKLLWSVSVYNPDYLLTRSRTRLPTTKHRTSSFWISCRAPRMLFMWVLRSASTSPRYPLNYSNDRALEQFLPRFEIEDLNCSYVSRVYRVQSNAIFGFTDGNGPISSLLQLPDKPYRQIIPSTRCEISFTRLFIRDATRFNEHLWTTNVEFSSADVPDCPVAELLRHSVVSYTFRSVLGKMNSS